MTFNWKRLGTTVAILVLPLLLTRCLITSVTQPASVVKGTQFNVTINGFDDNTPSNGAETDKGVLCVLVPTDWNLVSATYTAQVKGSAVVHNGILTSAQNWKDSAASVLPPPSGMKWIGLLSDSAYTYSDTLFMVATVRLAAGQTTGNFNLGYLMTKNGGDLIAHFSDGWSDTLMGKPITVTATGTSVDEKSLGGKPTAFALGNNYPNPFNPTTEISFQLPVASQVRLVVYDMVGREVAVLAEGMRDAGEYRVRFAPDLLSSGIYFYTLNAGSFTATHKMVYAK